MNGVKCFEFKTRTAGELARWVKAITACIERNKGKEVIPRVEKFWKFRLISESEFETKADTGDVLLFTGSQMGAKLQRLVTRSRFGTSPRNRTRSCRPHT